jgi:hypothetical protein
VVYNEIKSNLWATGFRTGMQSSQCYRLMSTPARQTLKLIVNFSGECKQTDGLKLKIQIIHIRRLVDIGHILLTHSMHS